MSAARKAAGERLPLPEDSVRLHGMAQLSKRAFRQEDISDLTATLERRLQAGAEDPAALMDLATLLQTHGRLAEAAELMRLALAMRRSFAVVHGDGSGPHLLAFVLPGDLMANTPVDFLLEGSNAVLWLCYLMAEDAGLPPLPPHHAALMAVGESPEAAALLTAMPRLLRDYPYPVLNNRPDVVAALTRDGVSARLATAEGIYCPPNRRLAAADLAKLGPGELPLVLRPAGTHAGEGMELLRSMADLDAARSKADGTGADGSFFAAPFVDYSDARGQFTKMRIVFIGGRAYPSHLAISDHWIVHYLSAGMATDPAKRAVEADWMARFDTDFALRHAAAFAALNRLFALDYFGIDCAETRDGRLLIFEADTAMIVHDMDDPEIFPYKQIAMRQLFEGFLGMVAKTDG